MINKFNIPVYSNIDDNISSNNFIRHYWYKRFIFRCINDRLFGIMIDKYGKK